MCSHVLESLNLMTLLNRWITHTFSVTRIARERQDELEFASMRPSRQLPSWCGSGWVVNVRELSPLISCQLVRCRIMVPSILYCSAIVIVSVEYMHLFRRPTQSISRLFIVCQCQFMAVNIRSFLISVTHLYTCTLKRCSLWHMHKAVGKVVTLSTVSEQFVKKWPNPLCSGFVCCCCCSFASNAQGHTWFTSVDLASSPRHAGTRRPSLWYIQSLFPKKGIVSKVTFADNYHGVLLLWKICAWGCPCATHSQPPLLNRRIPSLWKVAASSMQCLSVGFQRPTSSYGGGKNTTSIRGYTSGSTQAVHWVQL